MKQNSLTTVLYPAAAIVVLNTLAPDYTQAATEEIVVTGTRTETLLALSPIRTQLVTAEQITRRHAHDLKQALEHVSGIQLQKIHGKTGYEVWMQGVDADRVLILIDGEPVSASTGSSVDVTQIGIANIKRIEIIKGATSTLYGSSAIGGVINVITRKPEDNLEYQLKADAGSYGEQNPDGNAWHAGRYHASGYLGSAWSTGYVQLASNYNQWHGFQTRQQPIDWDQDGPDGHKAHHNLKLGFLPNDAIDAYLKASFYDEDVQYRTSEYKSPNWIFGLKKDVTERYRTSIGADMDINDSKSVALRYYYEDYKSTSDQMVFAEGDTLHSLREAEIFMQHADVQWTHHGEINTLVVGGNYKGATLNQIKYPEQSSRIIEVANRETNELSVFGQNTVELDPWKIVAGLRFSNRLTPSLNIRYDFDTNDWNHFVRLSLGKGYRQPGIKEKYYVFDHSQHGYLLQGNPDLVAESSNSAQLGWGLGSVRSHSLEANLFYNRIKNLIITDLNNTGSNEDGHTVFYYRNLDNSKTQGLELSYRYRGLSYFHFNAAYTYLETEDLDTGKELPKRPKNAGKLSILFDHPGWGFDAELSGKIQSSEYTETANQEKSDGYHTIDFRLNQKLLENLTVYTGISNLNNVQKDFANPQDFRPEQGRQIYLGLRLQNF